jgi:tRNA A-37 threonylcarbamoyl transferase component Bud32
MQQMATQHIAKHEVICLLSEGGMAQVYLGLSRGPANVIKLVVMKLIRSDLANDERFVAMFLDEARLAARLSHPNLVHTYEVLRDGGRYVLTMEYLDGQSLHETLLRIGLHLFPLEEHLWILTQILAGLQFAHTLPNYDGSPLGIVHRDVSPANTFITYNGDVKLIDFGIAKAASAVCITQQGTFKGKLNYCSPEQIQGENPPDARADIFAVGVMLWEAIAGRPLSSGETFAAAAQVRLAGRDPKIRKVCPSVPADLAEICDRAMALRPADRYLSAADFQRDLERHLERRPRRVGRAEVAELMRRYWGAEHDRMRKLIEEHLLSTKNAESFVQDAPARSEGVTQNLTRLGAERRKPRAAMEPAKPSLGDFSASEAFTPNAIPPAALQEPKPTPAAAPSSLPQEQKREPLPKAEPVATISASPVDNVGSRIRKKKSPYARPLGAAAALFVASFVAVGLWVKGQSHPKAARPSSPPVSSFPSHVKPTISPRPPDLRPPTASPSPTAVQAPSPETVHLDIRVVPAGAKLFLDERPVRKSWLRADVPKDKSIHVISALTPGYIPFNKSLTFEADVHLEIHLKGEPPRARSPASRRTIPDPSSESKSEDASPSKPEPSQRETDPFEP